MTWVTQAAYQAAGEPGQATWMLGMIQTIWRRKGVPISERRALLEQAEAELAEIPPGDEHDSVARATAFDRLVIEVDSNEFNAARRTGLPALAAFEAARDRGTARGVGGRPATGESVTAAR